MKRICAELTLFVLLLALVLALNGLAAACPENAARRAEEILNKLGDTPPDRNKRTGAIDAAKEICSILDGGEGALALFVRYDAVNRARTAAALYLSALQKEDAGVCDRARIDLSDALGTLRRAGAVTLELFV